VTEIRIYFEGDKALRPGFHRFLSQIISSARTNRIGCQLIAGRATAKDDFRTAQKVHPSARNILLLDSEGPDPPRQDSVFWMIQLMEAWFLADPNKLAEYYGAAFQLSGLKSNPRVEEIPRDDVLECLRQATRNTQKGPYHKTAHAPHILELIDPDKVRKAAPECDRLFREILTEVQNNPAQGR
jgi:Domain of unknown function (DUF4276)